MLIAARSTSPQSLVLQTSRGAEPPACRMLGICRTLGVSRGLERVGRGCPRQAIRRARVKWNGHAPCSLRRVGAVFGRARRQRRAGHRVATIQLLPRAHLNQSSRAASASTRSTTSVPRRRVFHTIGVQPSVGRMLLATIGSSTKSSNALRNRQRGPSRCGRSAGTSSR